MKPLDYGCSYVCFTGPANAVRFWIESRTRIIDRRGRTEDYYQCGACKSEHTWTTENPGRFLFSDDNHDFTAVFGPEYSVIFRRKAYLSDQYRRVVLSSTEFAAFGRPIYRTQEALRSRVLASNTAIREAAHAGLPLLSRTELANQESGLRAIVECPVKTLNINDQRDLYQVDTEPVAWPDLALGSARLADTIALAFVAFNCPTSADFIVESPTTIVEGGRETGKVHHYSRMLRSSTRSTAFIPSASVAPHW